MVRMGALAALLALATWLCVFLDLDLAVARFFFSPGEGWVLRDVQPWKTLYLYGTVPGILCGIAATAILWPGLSLPRLTV